MSVFHGWAPKPPMGWNSWDCFATTVTEEQVKAQADYMAMHLAGFGWEYIVVDIQWYEPNAKSFAYREGAELVLDGWGRLLPAENRFPSCAQGFKPLSDYVHERGLKFGVHLLRGIPRRAVDANLPIFGRSERARDIARTDNVCVWNPDMYGIDMSKPGAQAYYDSVFEQFAAWGVDYVKVDDISRPYHDNEAEIEAIRQAIDRTGRPMVLSLSPGATALTAAEHVKRHANLWRISDDFWDNWDVLYEQFEQLRAWNPHRGPGHWPDADMLPFGVLDLGRRRSRFTRDEHLTVMSLWAIARSPLMFGGDLTQLDDFTLSLLTNREVLEINQHSADNRPLFDRDGLIAWIASAPRGGHKYLALFNSRDRQPLRAERATFSGELRGGEKGLETQLIDVRVAAGTRLFLVADDGHGKNGDHHALVWGEPILRGPAGDLSLTELGWVQATSRWGSVTKNQTGAGRALLLGGRPVDHGLLVHTKSVIEFEVPAGYDRFVAECGFEGHSTPREDASRSRCLVFNERPLEPGQAEEGLPVEVTAHDLALRGPITVRDLWEGRELGTFEGGFKKVIPWHGACLFRVAAREG